MTPGNTEFVEIAPLVTTLLGELERQSFEWEGSLGELLDNSLDAAASRILIHIDKKQRRVSIYDNGVGCSEPHLMFVSGSTSKKRSPDALGRYGIGLKHASYYLARRDGSTTVVTSHAGVHQSVKVCWGEMIDRGTWTIEKPITLSETEVTASLPERKGTYIEFRLGRGRGFQASDQFEKLLRVLSFTFSPALRSGRQIEITVAGAKSRLLTPPHDPSWSQIIEWEFKIDHRTARMRAGILAADDKSGRRGFSYGFSHRVILQDTQSGCGDYSTAGFAGFVELDEHWRLGQNKSEVTDDAWQQLQDAIFEKVRPLLEKLRNATQHLQSEAIRGAVSNMLSSMWSAGPGNPKRPGRRDSRREEPKERVERPIRKATVVDGIGDVLGKRRVGGRVNIDWEDKPDAAYAARVDGNGRCIYLNRAKHVVRAAADSGNAELLAVIAGAHLFQHLVANSLYREGEFVDLMGTLLASPVTLTVAASGAAG